MKLNSPLLNRLVGLLAAAAVRWWMGTLDRKAAFYDPSVDPVRPDCRGQKIHIFWHEYLLLPVSLRGRCNLSMLLSRHRDAEVLSHVAHYLGYDFVRGSTNRGGVAALRELLRKSQRMHLAITPDGPRGPRRRLALGPIFLASRLGLPLVAAGHGYDRPWRLGSWDRFAIPRPWSRARTIVSGAIYVPPGLDREGLEYFREKVERLLNRLTDEAEAWAASGARKAGQYAMGPRYARRCHPAKKPASHLSGTTAGSPGGACKNSHAATAAQAGPPRPCPARRVADMAPTAGRASDAPAPKDPPRHDGE